MKAEPLILIQDLRFTYHGLENPVLMNVNLTVVPGESVAIVGRSGCGKSTLLQLIAGDLKADGGLVLRRGLWRRVFQSEALFPWLTVDENIRIGLRGVAPHQALEFAKLVDLLDLRHALKAYPRQLSGGLRQRTEIARALIGRPDGLLLDEPFSALDSIIRHETKQYLGELLKLHPIAMVLVTHDVREALDLTEKIFLLQGQPTTMNRSFVRGSFPNEKLAETIWHELKADRSGAISKSIPEQDSDR